MKQAFLLLLINLHFVTNNHAQAPELNVPDPKYVVQNWQAKWIDHPH